MGDDFEEDAADREARRKAAAEAARQAELRKRSHVMQRGLPRPASLELLPQPRPDEQVGWGAGRGGTLERGRRGGCTCLLGRECSGAAWAARRRLLPPWPRPSPSPQLERLSVLELAEELLQREYTALISYEAARHPAREEKKKGRGGASSAADVPPIEAVRRGWAGARRRVAGMGVAGAALVPLCAGRAIAALQRPAAPARLVAARPPTCLAEVRRFLLAGARSDMPPHSLPCPFLPPPPPPPPPSLRRRSWRWPASCCGRRRSTCARPWPTATWAPQVGAAGRGVVIRGGR